ncbi:MAG: acyl-CoA thioesterase [Deltaproteobacteria bacterium]|nr:acyl-CoA thioesterase [Deltaproteobacteria bacterium]NND27730.1 acyl-CoA thioesterase [Myxococcales bacterium]MBT8466180.1 acyl-CoA thioesterase [Deltaproteobacteria bacterium]MBT8480038.1 acyl-CoA thioesterase [Deltaproteobacteria bacterium]NNK06633.1 acyl-CoA thioesterase [Myxococcales bacterium]
MKRPFVYKMRVRFRDTDLQGHVYFGNYFVFCDEALGAYMRAVGVPWQDMVRAGTDMFYVNASCDYLGSARFEEDVHIETRISRFGASSFTSSFVIRNDRDETLAKASVTSVCVDPNSREKVTVPGSLRNAVAAFEDGPADG